MTPINLSHMEQASSCKLGDKVRVDLPGEKTSFALTDIAAPHRGGGDRFLDYSEVKGITFRIPACACTGNPVIITHTKVNTKKDFEQLRDVLKHTVWMENSVCWQLQTPSAPANAAPPDPPAPAPLVSPFKDALSRSFFESTAELVSVALETNVQSVMRGTMAASLEAFLDSSGSALGRSYASAAMGIGDVVWNLTPDGISAAHQEDCEELWVEEQCEGVSLPEE